MSILIEMPAIQFKGVKISVQNNDTGNKALYSIVNPDTGEVTEFTNLKTCKSAINDYLTTSDTGSINAPESIPTAITPVEPVLDTTTTSIIMFKGLPITCINNTETNTKLFTCINPCNLLMKTFLTLKQIKAFLSSCLATQIDEIFDSEPTSDLVYKVTFNKNNNYGNPSILPYTGTPEEIIHNIAVCSWFNKQTSLDYMLGYAARFKILTAIDLDTTTYLTFLQSLQFNHIITLSEVPKEVV